jgi:guanylate kinase
MNASPEIARRGIMLVVSSPSGAGKTTLTRNLLEQEENVSLSISVTTRARRASEIDGVHYHFIPRRRFETMRDADELLEWAEVHGNYYGTPREPVETALAAGRDMLFDIDWQGTQQLRQQVREDVVTIFVLPPSREELERRLRARAQDSAEVVARRMAKANDEISHWAEYDYVIVNDDIVRAQAQVETILEAERLKRARQPGIPAFVETLMRGD